MKTLKLFIEDFYNSLTTKLRANGSEFITLKDGVKNGGIYQDIIREMHDGLLPNDLIYAVCNELLACICDNLESDQILDDLDYYDFNVFIADYNFRTFNYYSSYMDQAIEEYGHVNNFSNLEEQAKEIFIGELYHKLVSEINDIDFDIEEV